MGYTSQDKGCAARRALGTDTWNVDLDGQPTDFFARAEHYVNQLDPLHSEARDPVFATERSGYYGTDKDRLQSELARLSGHSWQQAWKLTAPDTRTPRASLSELLPPRPT